MENETLTDNMQVEEPLDAKPTCFKVEADEIEDGEIAQYPSTPELDASDTDAGMASLQGMHFFPYQSTLD
jgi:hypothetical protein